MFNFFFKEVVAYAKDTHLLFEWFQCGFLEIRKSSTHDEEIFTFGKMLHF